VGVYTGWGYRQGLNIRNNVTSVLPAGYSVKLVLDTASLVNAAKLRADGNDLRVVWVNGSTLVELDRIAETAFNSPTTEIWFKTQAAIPASGNDGSYFVYYGNPSAGAPPANRANVYALWDDFDGGTLDSGQWNVTAGLVTVSDGQAHLAAWTDILAKVSQLNASLETRVQLLADNDYAWWGWEIIPNGGSDYLVFQEESDGFGGYTQNNWSTARVSLADPAGGLGTWHTYALYWWPGNVRWLIDGNQVGSSTQNVPDSAMYVSFYAYAVPMNVDWVKARLRVAQEPSVASCAPPPTPTATPTTTPSPTATPIPTPTPTPTPLPSLIFADSFESGNLSAWTSSATDTGHLSVSTAAAIVGTYGLRAFINDNNLMYVTDDRPLAEIHYRAHFYFDPNSITMASGNAHYIFYGYQGTSTLVLRTEFRFYLGNYQIRVSLRDDGTTWLNMAWVTVSDAPHLIEFDWRAATAVGANDGVLTLWLDGAQQAAVTGIDNDTRRIDRVRLGAVGGIDSGTRGTYYFDAFESRR